ncbi:MAG TPA: alpha/beta fold hydrolase [Vicinamibacterales bacterium]|nr:alpha/beta fold hydrolase [Vicinamibacterales bacterium]
MRTSQARTVGVGAGVLLLAAGMACSQLPKIGAGGLLHPGRRAAIAPAPAGCEHVELTGAGVTLRGWRCGPPAAAAGTIVYLHGIADNRGSAAGAIQRFTARGFQVIAYDSRAHGQSGGDACTYGVFEKRDLQKVLDAIGVRRAALIGTSLGAAVALQAAADDPRIAAVIAAETFSDLRTVATERAPFVFSRRSIARAFVLAEQQGGFSVDAASPVAAAPRIRVPVLLIHGAADRETPPSHSQRVFDALAGPKRLLLVPGAGHNQSLRPNVWTEIDRWLDALPPGTLGRNAAGG